MHFIHAMVDEDELEIIPQIIIAPFDCLLYSNSGGRLQKQIEKLSRILFSYLPTTLERVRVVDVIWWGH